VGGSAAYDLMGVFVDLGMAASSAGRWACGVHAVRGAGW
jgi:hypothetical protein